MSFLESAAEKKNPDPWYVPRLFEKKEKGPSEHYNWRDCQDLQSRTLTRLDRRRGDDREPVSRTVVPFAAAIFLPQFSCPPPISGFSMSTGHLRVGEQFLIFASVEVDVRIPLATLRTAAMGADNVLTR
jgi:hypothetical protein